MAGEEAHKDDDGHGHDKGPHRQVEKGIGDLKDGRYPKRGIDRLLVQDKKEYGAAKAADESREGADSGAGLRGQRGIPGGQVRAVHSFRSFFLS